MNLVSEVKSRFAGAEILSATTNPESVEVGFSKAKEVVTVINENGRYSVTYPEFVRDGRGGWKEEVGHSEGILLQGVIWLLSQVQKHGRVEPEIVD